MYVLSVSYVMRVCFLREESTQVMQVEDIYFGETYEREYSADKQIIIINKQNIYILLLLKSKTYVRTPSYIHNIF